MGANVRSRAASLETNSPEHRSMVPPFPTDARGGRGGGRCRGGGGGGFHALLTDTRCIGVRVGNARDSVW